jgi:hypothetical protein
MRTPKPSPVARPKWMMVGWALLLTLGTAGAAFSASPRPVLVATPAPAAGDAIPMKPIDGLQSLEASVSLNVNGLIDGERAQGDLDAVLKASEQGTSRVSVSGSLLGTLAAQVGGSLIGLFTPSSVDIYRTPQGAYIVVNSLVPLCIQADDAEAVAGLEALSPGQVLAMLSHPDVARGRYMGQEMLNGRQAKHYILDGEAFLAAAQASDDPRLRAFGEALWSASDADLYVDSRGGYPVAFRGSFSGTYEPLAFEGDFSVDVELTGIDTGVSVSLPAACNRPITP